MGLGIPPLTIKIVLESHPLKSTMLVRRLAVSYVGLDILKRITSVSV